jgi:hypothetical protein
MEIEACSFDDEDTNGIQSPRESRWHGHTVCIEDEGISHLLKPMEVGGGAKITLTADWGGKNGPQISIKGSGEIYDNKGNYAEVTIKQDHSGEGKVEVSAGHEKDMPK